MKCTSQGDACVVEGSNEPGENETIPKTSMKGPERRESIEEGREDGRAAQDFPTRKNEVGRPPDFLIREVKKQVPRLLLLKGQHPKAPRTAPQVH